jgi:hypothetical protein
MAYKIDKNKAGGTSRRQELRPATSTDSIGRDGYSPAVEFYELEPAIVVDVDLENTDSTKLGNIRLRPIYSYARTPDNMLPIAAPMRGNEKRYPLKGEVVICAIYSNRFYYTDRLNFFNFVNNNVVFDPVAEAQDNPTGEDYSETALGNPNPNSTAPLTKKPGKYFVGNKKIGSLIPLEGDIIYEGRFGQSIRFGGTVDDSVQLRPEFTKSWSVGKKIGSPILIIRNGQPESITKNFMPIVEDINRDGSSIYLTSDQIIPIKLSSNNTNSFKGSYPSIMDGKQIIIASDRVILNSKQKEILLSAHGPISLSTNATVNIDSRKETIINSPNVYLGLDAEENLILGKKTKEWLGEMISVVKDLIDTINKTTVLTGTGPSSPVGDTPTNVTAYNSIKNKLSTLNNKIDGLLSKQNYTV